MGTELYQGIVDSIVKGEARASEIGERIVLPSSFIGGARDMRLQSEYKLKTPDQFDKFVCSKIPDETKHPELYKLVVKHMMHRPCGEKNKNNSCMIDGNCKYYYPREFCEQTTQAKEGYPTYRRRRDNKTVQVRNAHLNNQ
ncbi:hypothetical protein LIER_15839 [Lithospermum erythrorhizon]|uniref:Uncharacterized protein n=1 Tax=Lithospermum erythrorhizon TaxID=34254 RepID=A0AAV3Q6A6_LITER